VASTPPRPRLVAVRLLDWDTAFFSARMGVIDRDHSAVVAGSAPDREHLAAELARDLADLLVDARAEGFAHLIFRAPADDLAAAWAAERAGLRLVDVGIDSAIPLGRATAALSEPDTAVTIRPAHSADVAALQELAAEAFVLSRFSADPFFSPVQVKAFHRQWVANLCAGLAQAVLVCEVDRAVAGFVSCALRGDEGRIPLIATDSRHRRRGAGGALVAAALRWFADAGARIVYVKTQAHNYPALALYGRAGFTAANTELTFSITLNPE
jgi:ribosomal protein S18 acetylase RimI-like enzyme